MKGLQRIILGALLISAPLLTADEEAQRRLGDVAFYAGDYRNAVSCYTSAMKLADEEKNADAWAASALNLATASLHLGEKERAREIYEEFRKRNPLRSAGTLESDLLAAEGKYAEAEKFLQELQTGNPAQEDARLFSLATLCIKTNRLEEAYTLFLIISGKAPDVWSPVETSAAVEALFSGRSGDAQFLLGKLAARPDSPWREFALSEAVYTLIRLRRTSEALALLNDSPAVRKNTEFELLTYLAEAYSGTIGNLKKNFSAFQEKISPRPHPRMLELLSQAAKIAIRDKDNSFAAMLLERALLFTSDPEIREVLRQQLVGVYTVYDAAKTVDAAKLFAGEFPKSEKRFDILFSAASGLYNRKEGKAALELYTYITETASGAKRLEAAANAVICAETLPDEAALEKFNRILIMESDFIERLNWQCRYSAYLERHGKNAEAEKELLSALEAADFSKQREVQDKINFLLLEFYIRTGNRNGINRIATTLQKAADPVYKAVSNRELGMQEEAQNHFAEARKFFLDAAKVDDPHLAPPAIFKAALMAFRNADFSVAANEFFNCAIKYPEYEKAPEALYMAIDLFDPSADAEKVKQASTLLREKYSSSKAFAVLILRQANDNANSGDLENILRDLRTVERNFPNTSYAGEALLLRAYFTDKQGREQEALSLLNLLHNTASPQLAAESLMRTGEILFRSGKYAQAGNVFVSASDKVPGTLAGDTALLRKVDCILSGKVPLEQQSLQEASAILEKLSGESKFPQVRLEAFYKTAVVMEHNGNTSAAISFYEKAIYTAVVMSKQGIFPENSWCVKSCSSALHLLASSGAAGALQRGMRLIDNCEYLMLGDEFIDQMRDNFRKQLKK